MSALNFVRKQSIFFFVHLLSCLVQLSSHILFEACASYLRFHLLRLIFVLIYRNFYNGGKNQYAQYSKSFFLFLALCTSLEMFSNT